MFVARREVKYVDKADVAHIFKPGDEVEGFENWDIIARRANLGLGWVEEVEPPSEALPTEVVHEEKTTGHFHCDKCSGRVFKSHQALKAHSTMVHKT